MSSSVPQVPSTIDGVPVQEIVVPGVRRGTHAAPLTHTPGGFFGYVLTERGWRGYGLIEQRPQDEKDLTFRTEDLIWLGILGLDEKATKATLRRRHATLTNLYHPDQNDGDSSYEAALKSVQDAYDHLKGHPAFA